MEIIIYKFVWFKNVYNIYNLEKNTTKLILIDILKLKYL